MVIAYIQNVYMQSNKYNLNHTLEVKLSGIEIASEPFTSWLEANMQHGHYSVVFYQIKICLVLSFFEINKELQTILILTVIIKTLFCEHKESYYRPWMKHTIFCRPPMEGWIISNRKGGNPNCTNILFLCLGFKGWEKMRKEWSCWAVTNSRKLPKHCSYTELCKWGIRHGLENR